MKYEMLYEYWVFNKNKNIFYDYIYFYFLIFGFLLFSLKKIKQQKLLFKYNL
jgi:hypothetical protein